MKLIISQEGSNPITIKTTESGAVNYIRNAASAVGNVSRNMYNTTKNGVKTIMDVRETVINKDNTYNLAVNLYQTAKKINKLTNMLQNANLATQNIYQELIFDSNGNVINTHYNPYNGCHIDEECSSISNLRQKLNEQQMNFNSFKNEYQTLNPYSQHFCKEVIANNGAAGSRPVTMTTFDSVCAQNIINQL